MPDRIIAILRGIQPFEATGIAEALIEAGISRLEVPLNSPDPYDSIANIIAAVGNEAQVGAGTVLNVDQVNRLGDIGAQMVISPNCDTAVIAETKRLGMESYPGVMTPSECFTALQAGADGLKFFPSSLIGPDGLAAIQAVLPTGTKTYAVGGAGPDNFAEWLKVGVTGFGIGGALYKPGDAADVIGQRAREMVDALKAASA